MGGSENEVILEGREKFIAVSYSLMRLLETVNNLCYFSEMFTVSLTICVRLRCRIINSLFTHKLVIRASFMHESSTLQCCKGLHAYHIPTITDYILINIEATFRFVSDGTTTCL